MKALHFYSEKQWVFPAKQLYLFPAGDVAYVLRVFRFALCFHSTEESLRQLRAFHEGNTQNRHAGMARNFMDDSSSLFDAAMDNPENYLLVIPLLLLATTNGSKTPVKEARVHLRALNPVCPREHSRAVMWRDLAKTAFFIFEGKKYEPPCCVCVHAFESLAGKCKFGGIECAASIVVQDYSTFEANIKEYEITARRINEPELENEIPSVDNSY